MEGDVRGKAYTSVGCLYPGLQVVVAKLFTGDTPQGEFIICLILLFIKYIHTLLSIFHSNGPSSGLPTFTFFILSFKKRFIY